MYEYSMDDALRKNLSIEQIKKYCERIDVPYEEGNLTEEYLERLIRGQLRSVPFDSATPWALAQTPVLDTDVLFDKIVTNKRGGYCFELNSLFYRFLRSLGFDCYLVIVYLRGNPKIAITNPFHCAIVVVLDGKKNFVDVGFGGNVPDGCVPFETGRYGYFYRLDGVYSMVGTIDAEGEFQSIFCFKDCPCDMAEIGPLNYTVSANPESGFRKKLQLNLRKDNGFVKMTDGELTMCTDGIETKESFHTKEEVKAAAGKYFGIPDLPVRDFE